LSKTGRESPFLELQITLRLKVKNVVEKNLTATFQKGTSGAWKTAVFQFMKSKYFIVVF
jgi:hypothetical protein